MLSSQKRETIFLLAGSAIAIGVNFIFTSTILSIVTSFALLIFAILGIKKYSISRINEVVKREESLAVTSTLILFVSLCWIIFNFISISFTGLII